VGTDAEGRLFFSMRFIKGVTLHQATVELHQENSPAQNRDQWTRQFRELLARFLRVCETIAFAHDFGLIHRDLKPANILLGAYGETAVLDWGLAKRFAAPPDGDEHRSHEPAADSSPSDLTQSGWVVGTPAYSAPERFEDEAPPDGPLTDIYSLGAILYESLTGQPPYRGTSAEVVAQVRAGPPVPPSWLKDDVPVVLEAICLKAMSRQRQNRYAHPQALISDIAKWLADEPVTIYDAPTREARCPRLRFREPVLNRVARWTRKHQAVAAGITALLFTAVVALSVGIVAVDRQRRLTDIERNRAISSEKEAVKQAEIANSRRLATLASRELEERRDRALLLGVEAVRIRGTREAGEILLQALDAAQYIKNYLYCTNPDYYIYDITFSRDGKFLAAGFENKTVGVPNLPAALSGGVVLWDVATMRRRGEPLAAKGGVHGVAFSPNSKTLAAGFRRGGRGPGLGGVELWDVESGQCTHVEDAGSVENITFSLDGKSLAAAVGGGVVLWDVATMHRRGEPLAAKGGVHGVAFSPDSKTLAAGFHGTVIPSHAPGVVLWDVASGERKTFKVPEGDVYSVAFSKDGKTLACGFHGKRMGTYGSGVFPLDMLSHAGGVVLWDMESGQRKGQPLVVAEGSVESIAFSPTDEKTLAIGFSVTGQKSHGGVVLLDVTMPWAGQRPGAIERGVQNIVVTEGAVQAVAFSHDGKILATGFHGDGLWSDDDVILWDVASVQKRDELRVIDGAGRKGIAVGADGTMSFVGADLESLERDVRRIANRNFSRDEWTLFFPGELYRRTFRDVSDREGVTKESAK